MILNVTNITMRLIDGDPEGIRLCYVEGKSLVMVIVPRDKLSQAEHLPGLPKRGVYFLLDEDHGNLSKVYAGQTVQGLSRLDLHKAKKEFWNKAVMFLDAETNIDRDVLDGLEAKEIDYIQDHGSYVTDNIKNPKPYVSPYKEGTVNSLHEDILFRMKALGFDLDRQEREPVAVGQKFHTKRNKIKAYGTYDETTGQFTVLSGSQGDLTRPIVKNHKAEQFRAERFSGMNGVVELEGDLRFGSPSAAAVFCLGGSANGWVEWFDDRDRTLNDVYRATQLES